jgi:N-acetylated-alpha-linked acidic dipeptidase
MLEIIRVLGLLRQQGWRPLRTIQFASWDASEYNFIGSTEYVENNLESLRAHGVAYLNVGVGVSGNNFRAAGSPALQKALLRAMERVSDPLKNATLKDLWDQNGSKLDALGTDGDYVPFQDMVGCASLDIGFEGQTFPRHSCYDSYELMEKYGDQGWVYHKMLAHMWVLVILELAQESLIPMDLKDYAAAIKRYVNEVQTLAESKGAQAEGENSLNFAGIWEAANLFERNAVEFHAWEDWWFGQVFGRGGFENNGLAYSRIGWNERLSQFDSALLDLPTSKNDKEENHGVSYSL